MPAPLIIHSPELSKQDRKDLREIFFESSSKKEFKDEVEKENFFYKYLGFYLDYYSDYLWVAKKKNILGYVIGMPNTSDLRVHQVQPHLKSFEAFFQNYPAHLHINLHSEARGTGVGSKLLQELTAQLQRSNIRGIHIMTSPDSRNVSFYQRLGFDFEVTQSFQGASILFMGKKLSASDE